MCFLKNHRPKVEHSDQRIAQLKNRIFKYCGNSPKIFTIDGFI